MTTPVGKYLKEIAEIESGDATELSFRTPMENMLKVLAPPDVKILQEPSRIAGIGAPDFRISAKGGGIIGYVECKRPGDNLRKLPTKKQLERYRALSGNILLTDSWRWMLLRDGERIGDVTLTEKPSGKTKTDFIELIRTFMEAEVEKIGDAKRLAVALAKRCAMLREGLEAHEDDDSSQSRLHGLLGAFRTALDSELSFAQFAGTFAQTTVYSLLLAKLKAPTGVSLDLYVINRHIPDNFAVIREITAFLQDLRGSQYEGIAWVVDDILAIINSMDSAAVSESMSYGKDAKGISGEDDPYIYFYENFLAAYDAKLRERRGVYYTPPPVVKFIVRAVDDVLRRDFDLPNGLAETDAVTALDFAAGTGTFMLEMIRTVLAGAGGARRDMLTHEHILKNFYGFELLMAPYAIAHLKLSQFLADNDVPLKRDERINIFLTNTLEKISEQVELPMMPTLAEEANRAQKVKDSPVLVICGNPPYSGHSQNKGDWITGLIRRNYIKTFPELQKPGQGKWLQDDYVKFIRFAQWKMDAVERGIVAIITNHSYLENPTFRGMRQSLLETFDALYFLDLHGNAKKKEVTPEGNADENVFDIQQGVAIAILIKNPQAKQKGVFHADFWGRRADKYAACLENGIDSIDWKILEPAPPLNIFIPRDERAAKKYESFWSISDIFNTLGSPAPGIVTTQDQFAISFTKDEALNKVKKLLATDTEEEARALFRLCSQAQWNYAVAKKALAIGEYKNNVSQILYRPFDMRWTIYDSHVAVHRRERVMKHMLMGENVGIGVSKRQEIGGPWQHVFVSDKIIQHHTATAKEVTYLLPLYRYDIEMGKTTRNENLNPEFRRWLDNRYGKAQTPEDILNCIYAILHSPAYRKDYVDFLRTDFPRIPFPKEQTEFTRLAAIGGELISAHLMRANCTGELAKHEGAGTSHKVEKVSYQEKTECLYFNKTEWLAPLPPEIFNFQIGGYQPIKKYLESRKNRTLTLPEIETLQKSANAILFTKNKIEEIDP